MDSKQTPMASEDRRAFLRRAGATSLSVPAAALLLSVTNKRAQAEYGRDDQCDICVKEE